MVQRMARFKHYDYEQTKMIPLRFVDQIQPGTFEYTLNHVVDNELDLSVFESRYRNDHNGAPAYDPALLLKIVLFAYSRMDEVIAPLFTHVLMVCDGIRGCRRKASDYRPCPCLRSRPIDSPMGRHIYSKRLGTVEPVFGNLESNKGLKRFTLRGKEKVMSARMAI